MRKTEAQRHPTRAFLNLLVEVKSQTKRINAGGETVQSLLAAGAGATPMNKKRPTVFRSISACQGCEDCARIRR
jgi:hypothetical protein